jgi:uncharacterized protein YdhG (YjbR/CyaY superfamily)
MKNSQETATTVDRYINGFPKEIQLRLEQLRSLILKAAPKAEEVISYGMPAYNYKGRLVYFSGYKNHIGFYPMPDVIEKFKKEISVYKNSKGTVQFPHDIKLPSALITKMVKYRMKLNDEAFKLKVNKKSK